MPSATYTLAANNDDADELDNGSTFTANGTTVVSVVDSATSSTRKNVGGRFIISGTAPAHGDTITAATLDVFVISSKGDDPSLNIYLNNVDNAVDFASDADVTTRIASAATTANTSWSASNIGTNAYKTSPDFAAAVQEVIDRAGWAVGNAMVVLLKGKAGVASGNTISIEPNDDTGHNNPMKLNLTWTVAKLAPPNRPRSQAVTRAATR